MHLHIYLHLFIWKLGISVDNDRVGFPLNCLVTDYVFSPIGLPCMTLWSGSTTKPAIKIHAWEDEIHSMVNMDGIKFTLKIKVNIQKHINFLKIVFLN